MKEMLKILFLICVLFSTKNTIHAQEEDYLANEPFGSAKNLTGKTVVVNCFVSDGKDRWSDFQKKEVLAKEQEGFTWLKEKAGFWHVPVPQFETSNMGMDSDVVFKKMVSFDKAKRKHWLGVKTLLAAAGYNNSFVFYDSVKKANNADHVVILFYIKEEGRSYAQPSNSDNKFNPRFLEGAFIYFTSNLKGYKWATIVHEMLHLFGAWDMYHKETRSEDMDWKVRGAFGNSVMLDSWKTYNDTQLDQMTAWRIGWTKKYWYWYEMFRPEIEIYWKETN